MGMDPDTEPLEGRALVEDYPARDFNPDETDALAMRIDFAPKPVLLHLGFHR